MDIEAVSWFCNEWRNFLTINALLCHLQKSVQASISFAIEQMSFYSETLSCDQLLKSSILLLLQEVLWGESKPKKTNSTQWFLIASVE
jgi:hypothetical protein